MHLGDGVGGGGGGGGVKCCFSNNNNTTRGYVGEVNAPWAGEDILPSCPLGTASLRMGSGAKDTSHHSLSVRFVLDAA
jgi:hypothetical protein